MGYKLIIAYYTYNVKNQFTIITGRHYLLRFTWTGSALTGSTWTGSALTGSALTGSTWTGSALTGSTWTGSALTGSII